jgi:hypothetical protein
MPADKLEQVLDVLFEVWPDAAVLMPDGSVLPSLPIGG